ncbi:class I SAM-dependent methyltransferase [Jeotgalibacillus proteolyticus]|uniref:class I SAM-dependent methyltransferase n=1 Tax=Jeotgalibacillus proteolyticus TaxID=2082395 RepID=UPI003CE8180C
MGSEEAARRWNDFAEDYAEKHSELGDLHKEVLLNPVIMELAGDIQNKKLLDAGCGEGYLSRLLAKAGATVTAVDYSEKMLEIAQNRTISGAAVNYFHGSLENLSFLEERQFDLVISNMVLHDLQDYEKALQQMYQVLSPGGTLIFSILHPAFITPVSSWERTPSGEKLFWKVDRYFDEGVFEQPLGGKEKMLLFHRTLSNYVNQIVQTGFTLEQVVEPRPSDHMLEKYPSFKSDLRRPDFIVFKAVKEPLKSTLLDKEGIIGSR